MADLAFQLVVRKGPRPGQIFPLEDDAISIGRDPVSTIVIDDPEISRHHARLSIGPAGYYLQDMASTNGSFVDGQRLGGEPVALNAGQVIMFGSNVTLVYQVVPESDPMATVVAPVSLPVVEELAPDEPVQPPDQEPLEVVDELEIAAVVASDSPEIEEEEIAVEVAAPESFEIEEEEIVDEVPAPESFEVEEEVIEAEAVVAEPERSFEEPDDDEDLATIIDEPFVPEEPSPEPEIVPEISEGFPTFDDVADEPDEAYDEQVVPAPFVFEEPEPEMIPEPEVVAPVIEEIAPPLEYGLDATMPDVESQPVMESPTETMEPSEAPKGGVDRTVIIAIVMLVIMCCCVFGTILALIVIDTWVEQDLIEGLELGAVWFFRGLRFLVH